MFKKLIFLFTTDVTIIHERSSNHIDILVKRNLGAHFDFITADDVKEKQKNLFAYKFS